MSTKPLEVLQFDKQNIPQPYETREVTDNKFVYYGLDNLYPNYLLKLYAESPIHASIINAKTTYIIGDGLKYADGKDLSFQVNASDNVKEFVDKLIKDYLIFNAMAVEVLFNSFGEPVEYHHVPFQKIRMNRSKTKFWFNEDWTMFRKTIVYDRFTNRNKDATSKIFFFDGYFPSINLVYPQPEYNGAIKSVATDIAIREFNLNNIKNHFSVSTLITFFMGANVADDVKSQIVKDLKDSYTGENGKKMIVDFQNIDGKPAEVKSLSPNDWDKAYAEVARSVSDDIYKAHQVTSPSLMGVKDSGQLGGSQELETAYEIFKNTYIRVKRDEVESALNLLFSTNKNIQGKVAFADKPLFNATLSEALKEKVLTINELRAEAGFPALPDGDKLIGEIPRVSEAVKPGETPPTDMPPVPVQQEEEKKNSSRKLTEEDYDKIHHLGNSFDDFEIIGEHQEHEHMKFGDVEDVADYVIKNDIKGLTISEVSDLLQKDKGVNVSVSDLKDILNRLDESGVVKVDYDDAGRVKVTPNKVADLPETGKISVMYRYIKRPDVDGPDLLPTSRSFCTKLIENNRLYLRSEIQQMSALFGYSIFDYAGGFRHDAETGKTYPFCRHTWQALKVKKRD